MTQHVVETREDGPLAVVEEAGVAFDPTTQVLDLTKDEKRRTTALMLAIQGYKELIIKDAAYLREAYDAARRGEGPKIGAATMDGMLEAAVKFDMFIAGEFAASEKKTRGGAQTEVQSEDALPEADGAPTPTNE